MFTEYILVVAFYAGMLSSKDSVAMTTIPGFRSEKACIAAGDSIKLKFETMMKTVNYVCVGKDV